MRGLVLSAAVALVGACTLGRLDGLTGGSPLDHASDGGDDGSPATTGDAGPTEAVDAGDAGPSGVLLSDSFDDPTTCNDTSFNSVLSESPNGRTDGFACKVCGQSSSVDSFSYRIDVPGAVTTLGARYHVTAWYRNPSAGPTAPNLGIAVRSFLRQSSTQVEVSPTFAMTATDWRRIDADLVLTKPADAVDVFIGETYGAGVCFVFDDLVVTRLD